VLFVEGQSARGVHMVCKGRVKMTMSVPDGKTMIVRFAEAGELLGLHASISGEPYELTAETVEPCQINFIRRDDFLKLLREHPETYASTVEQLSTMYRSACEQIRCLGLTHTATEKLASFLLQSARKGQETNQGVRFHLGLTHEEIAQLVGVSRETVTRGLSELRQKSLIATKGSNVVIRNKPALEAMVAA
jgi:CRP/FNR family transcriptional regulator, cyclic AMP receptor protein